MFPVMNENPFMKGYLQGIQGRREMAAAKTQEEQLKTLPEMLQAQLMSEQQRAHQAQITNQYLPDELQSKIALNRAQVPLLGAQTSHMNMMTNLMPGDQLISAQNALTNSGRLSQSASRFDNVYKLQQFMKMPAGQDFFSKNPQFAEAAMRVIAGTGNQADEQILGQIGLGGEQEAPQSNPLVQKFQNAFGMDKSQQARPQQDLSSLRQNTMNYLGISPENVASAQDATGSALLKNISTPAQLNQRLYETSIERMFEQTDPIIKDVASFSGLKGATKEGLQKTKSMLGLPTSDEYKNFRTFSETQAPLLANEFRKALGGQATDHENKLLASIANPKSLTSNPELYIKQYNALKDILMANAAAINQSGAQTHGQINDILQQQKQMRQLQQAPKQESPAKIAASDGNHYSRAQLMQIVGQ